MIDYASKEVIVSAGFIDTPKLFLLSGVGPEKELQKLGIEVIHDSPNVGKNLRDHSSVLINPVFSQDLKIPGGNSLFADADRLALEKKRWLDSYNGGKGEAVNELSRYGSSFAIAFNKYPISQRTSWPEWKNLTDAQKELFLDPKRPDTEILFIPGFLPPGATIPSGGSPNPFFQLFLLFQNQISRGEITLANRDPEVPAVLNPNYLTHPMDVRNCIETVKTTLRILRGERYKNIIEGVEFMSAGQTPVFIAPNKEQMEANTKKAVNGLYLNGIDGESDEIIEKWLRNSGIDQGYHGQGTMRMGKEGDPLRVVDSSGRVVGLESLRVADASVMPHLMK